MNPIPPSPASSFIKIPSSAIDDIKKKKGAIIVSEDQLIKKYDPQ
jgi:hypothetical protein